MNFSRKTLSSRLMIIDQFTKKKVSNQLSPARQILYLISCLRSVTLLRFKSFFFFYPIVCFAYKLPIVDCHFFFFFAFHCLPGRVWWNLLVFLLRATRGRVSNGMHCLSCVTSKCNKDSKLHVHVQTTPLRVHVACHRSKETPELPIRRSSTLVK